MKIRSASILLISLVGAASARTVMEEVPGGARVSSNQMVTPAGRVARVEGARPKDAALSPNGRTLAVLAQNQVILYDTSTRAARSVPLSPGPLGIAWASNSTLYVSGDDGQVFRVNAAEGTARPVKVAEVVAAGASGPAGARSNSPNGKDLVPLEAPKGNPQVAGLAASKDGRRLYVTLGIRNAVLVIDLAENKTLARIPVGVAPYRLALSPDGGTLLALNRGGREAKAGEKSGPSAESRVLVDAGTDAALRGSITFVNTRTFAAVSVDAGRQPSAAVFSADGRAAYVANSDDDTVSIVDVARRKVKSAFSVRPPQDPGFGQMPNDLALSSDGKTMFVSCGGANAAAAVDVATRRVKGYIPTGWFPIAVATRGDRLFVASSKGFGSRRLNSQGASNVHGTVGTVQFIGAADWKDLRATTRRVAANNHWGAFELPARKGIAPAPVPARVGEPSVFHHVVYIIKENHTYDLDLGDMPEGNGDKSLCIFGEKITPNEHAISRQFVLLDNTYTSGTNSADGHQWTDSALANAYQEQNYSSNARSYPYDGGDALAASPSGFLWNAAVKARKSLRVYGEFVNKPSVVDPATGKEPTFKQLWDDRAAGSNRYRITAATDTAALRPYLHPNYIGWPVIVSDQYRADTFLADLKRFEANGSMPSLCMLLLPCNHTSGTDPGFPTPRASVADNDRALGRIVEGISRSAFWKDTLILVIEDDSQFGVDHVDGHRTLAFCVSPYTRRGVVVSEPYNHTSVLRTIGLTLGIPAMNRFDRTATPMTACFTSTPDLRPFTSVESNVPLDELNPSLSALSGQRLRLAAASHRQNFTSYDRADPSVMARAAWHSQRPGIPFPAKRFHAIVDDD
ncbi:MAG TPA: alkaline phosphatase family protein [Armatimonadota bacterium]|jgi:YVTN family beta-propeller protein